MMLQLNPVTQYVVEDRVAVATINSPPVNALGHAVREGISAAIERSLADPDAIAMVLICAGRTFFAGADIREFGRPLASPVLREIGVQMEAASKPLVAAIHGTALGGGLEVALACHWRIAAADAKLGLPEVKLGLLAGAGGTQRLPRLVGATMALDMVVSGDPIDARSAFSAGLVDALAETDLRADAIRFARGIAEQADRLRRVRDLPPPTADARLFADFRAAHAERLGGFEAPEASIKCIEAATFETFEEGMRIERELFDGLMPGVQCAAQRYNFFAEREAAKVPGLGKDVSALPLDVIAIRGKGALAARLEAAGIGIAEEGENRLTLDVRPAGAPTMASGSKGVERTVPVRLAPEGDAQLIEMFRSPGLGDAALAAALAVAKRLGLTSVVTLAGDEFIGRRMAERLAIDVGRCLDDGIAAEALGAAAGDFGLEIRVCAPAGSVAGSPPQNPDDIIERLVVPQINEGAHLLEGGGAARASDIDIACVKSGMWKVYRGGPMFHAGQIGLARVIEILRSYEARWGKDYRPAPLLERLAAVGATLHDYKGD